MLVFEGLNIIEEYTSTKPLNCLTKQDHLKLRARCKTVLVREDQCAPCGARL